MKKCIICLLVCCCKVCSIYAMDLEKKPDINQIEFMPLPAQDPRAVATSEIDAELLEKSPSKNRALSPEEFDGSCEQVCGFWTCGCASTAGLAYVLARLTPTRAFGLLSTGVMYPKPLAFRGWGGPNEFPPEQELMGFLVPVAGTFACASHTEPDYHSCLLGNARTAGRKIGQVFSGLMRRLKNSHNGQTTYDPDAPQAGIFACLHQQNDGKKTE